MFGVQYTFVNSVILGTVHFGHNNEVAAFQKVAAANLRSYLESNGWIMNDSY